MPRLLSLTIVGGSGLDPYNRCTGDLSLRGWSNYADKIAATVGQTDGFILKNPFGTLPNEPMQMTQVVQAQRVGLNFDSTFVRTWQPVCKAFRDLGKEPIVYLGGFAGDRLWYATPAGQRANLFKDSFSLFVQAGFTFALDWFSNLDANPDTKSDALDLLRRLRTYSNRTRIYVEPLPTPGDTWAMANGIGAMLSNYNAAFKWTESRLSDTLPMYAGDVVVHIDDDRDGSGVSRGWNDPRWIVSDLQKAAKLGWSAAVPIETGVPWEVMRDAMRGAVTT